MDAGYIIVNKDLVYKRALWRVCVLVRIMVRKDAPPARLCRGFWPFALWSRDSNKEKTYKRKGNPDNKQRTTNKENLCHSRIVATAFARGFPLLAAVVASAIRSNPLEIRQRNGGYRFDHHRHP